MVTVIVIVVVIRHTLDRGSGVFSSLGQHEQPLAPWGTETVGRCGVGRCGVLVSSVMALAGTGTLGSRLGGVDSWGTHFLLACDTSHCLRCWVVLSGRQT